MGIDWRQGLPVLRGSGVVLREPRLADSHALFTHLTTTEVTRFISAPPDTPKGFERYIGWVQHERHIGRHLCYAIVPEGGSDAVGLIQVRAMEPGFSTAEWGFALAEPYWGTGLFLTCARLVVDFVFRHVGSHRLEARSSVHNRRGIGMLKKLGATQRDLASPPSQTAASQTEQVLWSLSGEDWLASNPGRSYGIETPVTRTPETELPCDESAPDAEWRRRLPVLRGDGVYLRELQVSDAHDLTLLYLDRQVRRYIPPPPTSVSSFERFVEWGIRQREAGQYVCYGVVPEQATRPVGIFQVHQLEPPFRTAEWGFVFGRPYWGSGIMPRGAGLLLGFIFETLGVKRLEARAMAANARANGALRKLGATEEGRLPRSFLLGRQHDDDVLWVMLDSDWLRVRERDHPSAAHT